MKQTVFHTKYIFQFYKVRLERQIARRGRTANQIFQFYKVRLEPYH